jgi:hypothetical protein
MSDLQERIDQLTAQLSDAIRQCGVMAELLRDLRPDIEVHLHNSTVMKSKKGIERCKKRIERIDAALAGKLPEQRINKPARIGGVVFQPGVEAFSVLEAAYRAAENHEPNPAAFQELQDAMLARLAPAPAVPDELDYDVELESGDYDHKVDESFLRGRVQGWNDCRSAMLASAQKPEGAT